MEKYKLHVSTNQVAKNDRWSTLIRVEQDDMTNQKVRLRFKFFFLFQKKDFF